MEAALWSAIAILATLSIGTLVLVIRRIDGLSAARIDGLGSRIDTRLDGHSARIDTRLGRLSARVDGLSAEMNTRFDRVDDRLTQVEGRLVGVERDLHAHISRDAGR
jgi:hypothetical protein